MKPKYSAEEMFQKFMESFTDNVTQAEMCRRHGIYYVQLSKWKGQFIQGGKSAWLRGGIPTLETRRSRTSRR